MSVINIPSQQLIEGLKMSSLIAAQPATVVISPLAVQAIKSFQEAVASATLPQGLNLGIEASNVDKNELQTLPNNSTKKDEIFRS